MSELTPEQVVDEIMLPSKEYSCDCPHVTQADCDWCFMREAFIAAMRAAEQRGEAKQRERTHAEISGEHFHTPRNEYADKCSACAIEAARLAGWKEAKMHAENIAWANDSGRGYEKQIAEAIAALTPKGATNDARLAVTHPACEQPEACP